LPLALLDVKGTVPLAQNVVVVPLEVIVGVAGIAFTVTVVAAEGALLQPLAVTMLV
jgi:hypothetical protein